MLNCKKCRIPFTKDARKPLIYKDCGHTLCHVCIYDFNTNKVKNCQLCNSSYNILPNRSRIGQLFFGVEKPIEVIENRIVLDYIEDMEKSLLNDVKGFILRNQINQIETTCKVHKEQVVGYSMKSFIFVCQRCKKNQNEILTLKEIVDHHSNIINSDIADFRNIIDMVNKLEDLQAFYNGIKTKTDNGQLFNISNAKVKEIIPVSKQPLLNNIIDIIAKRFGKYTTNLTGLTTILDHIVSIKTQYLLMASRVRAQLNRIIASNYKFDQILEYEIKIEKAVDFDEVNRLYKKYLKKNEKIDSQIKKDLNECLAEILCIEEALTYSIGLREKFSDIYLYLYRKN